MIKIQGLPKDVATALDREFIDDAFELMRRDISNPGIPFAQKIYLYKGLAAMYREYQQDERAAADTERELYNIIDKVHPELISVVSPDLLARFEKDGIMPNYNLIYGTANHAFNERKFTTCLKLINGFQKNHPEHHDVPNNLLLAAKVFMVKNQYPAKALAILDNLETRYPASDLIFEIKSLKRAANRANNI